jgi:hypothetical protein
MNTALLQFLQVPHKHWPLAVEGTVIVSVNAFYFLHRVRFVGLSEGGLLLGTVRGYEELEADTSHSSDLGESRMIRGRCKRGSSWGHGVGTTSQQGSKRLKGSDQTYVYPLRAQINSKAGLATVGETWSAWHFSSVQSGWARYGWE